MTPPQGLPKLPRIPKLPKLPKVPRHTWSFAAIIMLTWTVATVVSAIGEPRRNCDSPVGWTQAAIFLGWMGLIAWLSYKAGKDMARP